MATRFRPLVHHLIVLWMISLRIDVTRGFASNRSATSDFRRKFHQRNNRTTKSPTTAPHGSFRGSASSARAWSTVRDFPETEVKHRAPDYARVLSQNPLVYIIPNLLSDEECQGFLDRIRQLDAESRKMELSNPPQVSLDTSKLWPLPILSMVAGLPPVVRFMQNNDGDLPPTDVLISLCGPPITIALIASLVLAFGVVLPAIRSRSDQSSRTSSAMALNLEEDISFVATLVDRVCAATEHPWHAWEAPVMTRYTPGAIFARHADASPTRGSEWADTGGQRTVTCICYLNTLPEGTGGETYFDQLGFAVSPVRGQGLVFFPAVQGPSLDADERMTHESLPATQDKYIIQMFGRVGPRVPPPLGLPDAYDKREK